MKSILKTIIPLSLVFAVLVSTNFLYAQWTAPSGTPSASNNAATTVNTSATDQVKEGGLSVGTLSVTDNVYIQAGNTTATSSGAVNLEVEGKVGSGQFCDTAGNNCFSATEVRNIIDNNARYTIYTVFDKGYYWGRVSGWLSGDPKKRRSYATAVCNTNDYALRSRGIGKRYGSNLRTYSATINLYNSMDPSYFDTQGIGWQTYASSQTLARRDSWNNDAWFYSRGSVAAVEVECLKINW